MTVLTVPRICPTYGVEGASHFLHNWFMGCEGLAELLLRPRLNNRTATETGGG